MMTQNELNEIKRRKSMVRYVRCPKCDSDVPENAMITFNLDINGSKVQIRKCYWCAT